VKILCLGDLHLTDRKPRKRKEEDWLGLQLSKLEGVIAEGQREANADPNERDGSFLIIQPGDFFDSHRTSYSAWGKVARFLSRWPVLRLHTIYGQHDMRFHSSDIDNTPLGALAWSGFVTTIPNEGIRAVGDVYLYGMSWGQEIPEILDEEGCHILVAHRMVIEDEKLWEGQEEFERSAVLLRKTKFDLIVTGDNHRGFTCRVGDRWLVNAGSLCRTTTDQVKHHPAAYIYDTHTKDLTKIEIPIKPLHEVMDMEEGVALKKRNEMLDTFVRTLKEGTNFTGLNFKRNVDDWLKKCEDKDIVEFVEEVMNEH
jgi:hypothetical protein